MQRSTSPRAGSSHTPRTSEEGRKESFYTVPCKCMGYELHVNKAFLIKGLKDAYRIANKSQ
jgi:hypothetical protein